MVTIVRVITRLNIGGPSIHVALLTNHLDRQRFSTCVAAGQPDRTEGDFSELVSGGPGRLERVTALRRSMAPWADVMALWALVRIIWRERPRIVHTHMAKAGALGRVAAVLYNTVGPGRALHARACLVHTFHGHVLEGYFSGWMSRLFVIIERILARQTDRLVAVSDIVKHELLAMGIGAAHQWRVVPLGLDLAMLASMPAPAHATLVRCGLIGRLVAIKNPGLFLRGIRQVADRAGAAAIQGVIVGDGPLRGALEREVDALGLRRIVQFTGWQRDLPAVYQDLDVACVTSWNEGTPVSLIEAMAAGRAIVSTDVGGVRDVLGEGRHGCISIPPGGFHLGTRGMLVRAGDAEGLAHALETLRTRPDLRLALGRAARVHVVHAYSAQRLIRDITALYDQLLTQG